MGKLSGEVEDFIGNKIPADGIIRRSYDVYFVYSRITFPL